MDVHLDIMFHHGRKFQKDENGMTIYSPDKKACVCDIDVDTLDVFWVRNYYKKLGYDRIGECWWHVPGRSLDSGLRALNCDDELREMCFMGEKNDGLVDVYFEHTVSTPEILEGNEIVVYVKGDYDDLREVSDEPDNEPLQDKIPNQTNIPTARADETLFTNNNEPMHNTSPPKSTEPTDPGANNPTPQKYNPTTTSNSNPSQATTAKPVSKTPPVIPKTKPNSNANPNLKSNNTSSSKANANPKNASKPKPKPNRNSVSKPKLNPKPKITTKAYCTSSYDPGIDDSSSDDDVVGKKCEPKRRESGLKHAPAEGLAKSKRKFLNDDDALVVDDEECEVDLSFLEVLVTGDKNLDNALDPGAESDGANFWHSKEMKTPPPSEDEFSEEEPDDVFLSEFREAVREFTIQEGRRIQFIKNDAVRCGAVCKAEECKWVVYASRDHEETCWQIKTFNDDHTCAREATNRAANRNWLTNKLVKKCSFAAVAEPLLPNRSSPPPRFYQFAASSTMDATLPPQSSACVVVKGVDPITTGSWRQHCSHKELLSVETNHF
ncbi:hypothetical protein Ahy_B06g084413 [Arachis hypogaea]|uniref:Uncharacterized protein n=1 Tax=Arachis hypogaea TaxID=3818 RepID=A0A444YRT5_ARAHY|nr:hypothetical protein Ahy_B06g084413 [Arachis hypogaea]